MNPQYQLRVVFKAGVGAMARVLQSIAQLQGTVSTIDLQTGSDDVCVADMTIRLEIKVATVDCISDALRTNRAGIVAALRPVDHAIDPVLRAIRWACNMVGAGSAADDELRRVLREICTTPDTWFLSIDEAQKIDIARTAAQKWAPIVNSLPTLPEGLDGSFSGPAIVLAVPDARLEPTGIAVVARTAGRLFSGAEIERVEAILALYRRAALTDTHNLVESEIDETAWFASS